MSDFEFMRREGEDLTLDEAVLQALGFASTCWVPAPFGVFDSERAKQAGDALVEFASKPRRGDDIELWLKHRRDQYVEDSPTWTALDDALDYYRECSDTGTHLWSEEDR